MRTFLRASLLLICIGITLYRLFFDLGRLPAERWDEETNLHVVNTIIALHIFPALSLDGSPFFEKPPLWYWTAAVSGMLFSDSLIAIRTISAIAGFLTISIIAWTATKWWGAIAGFTSWFVLITTNHIFIKNPAGIFSTHTFRSADVDSLYIFFLTLSFIASCSQLNFRSKSLLTGVFSALAILTKGPIGVLPFIFLPKKSLFQAIIICTILVIPWYTYMTVTFGQPFISTHILYHLIQRSMSPIEGHTNPWWYFVSLLTNRAFFLSWELAFLSVIWPIIHRTHVHDRLVRATIVMFILCLIIPSAAQTRLAWYILPFYPFAALSIGALAASFHDQLHAIWYSKGK